MKFFITKSKDAPIFIGSDLTVYQPGEIHDRRRFPIFNMIVVYDGRMYLNEDGIEYEIKSGEYFIQERYSLHYGLKPDTKPMTFSFIHFSLPDGYDVVETNENISACQIVENGRFLRPDTYQLIIPKYGKCSNSFLNTAYELSLGLRQGYSLLKSKGLFYKLFDELIESSNILDSENVSTKDIKSYINRYYTNEDFSLDWLCEKFFFSRQYVTRILKKQTGMNFRDYVSSLKIEHAKNLLASRSASVSNIAITLGYANTAAFCFHFKKKTGKTPSEYQKLHLLDDKLKITPNRKNINL